MKRKANRIEPVIRPQQHGSMYALTLRADVFHGDLLGRISDHFGDDHIRQAWIAGDTLLVELTDLASRFAATLPGVLSFKPLGNDGRFKTR
ncbi:MAG TPA: hypothetical protein V6D22_04570 [Candidatus Obscuribacterales bacterium]